MPLDVCVADSQGGIGYMIERIFRNVLNKYQIERNVVTLVGMVEVDPEDPAFRNPTKRIGATYSFEQAKALEVQKGWSFKESKKSGNGWRRVVPSPVPKKILNLELIGDLARKETL